VSSTAPRAFESAKALKKGLGSRKRIEEEPYIWYSGDAPSEIDTYYWSNGCEGRKRLVSIVSQREKSDALIIVSHMDISEYILLPWYSASNAPIFNNLGYSEAILIDFDRKISKLFSQK
jgi:hypothetical protein